MFYEWKRSLNQESFLSPLSEIDNFSFPLHLHSNYEFLFVEEGMMSVSICGHSFSVSSGEGAFILANQPHEFFTPIKSRCWIIIFSSDYIPELKNILSEKGAFHPVIRPERPLLRQQMIQAKENPMRLRSILYELAALYCEGEPAPQLAIEDGELLGYVVSYIDAHYREPMTLDDLSRALGYSYRYMSGVVNRFFKMPLPQVVNRYRVNHACKLLMDTDMEITEIAMNCGFGSIRNFNRSFRSVIGVTPRDYRKQHSLYK